MTLKPNLRHLLVALALLAAVLILPPDALIPRARADVTCSTVAMTCATGTSLAPLTSDGTNLTLASGQLLFPAGTAALPSVSTSGDPDTGMWWPAANRLGWSTAGVERMNLSTVAFYPNSNGIYSNGLSSNRWSAGYWGGQTLTTTVTPLWDGSVTWNDAATSHRGIKLVAIETAASATSKYLDILGGAAGTTPRFYVTAADTRVIGDLIVDVTDGGDPEIFTANSTGAFVYTGLPLGFYSSTRSYAPANGEWDFRNAAGTINAGLRHSRIVEVVTTTKSPSALENGELYSNTGDTDGSAITLLNDPTIGTQFCAAVDAAQTVTVAPSAGETIVYAGTSYSTSCTSATIGSVACPVAMTGGSGAKWVLTNVTGTWTCS